MSSTFRRTLRVLLALSFSLMAPATLLAQPNADLVSDKPAVVTDAASPVVQAALTPVAIPRVVTSGIQRPVPGFAPEPVVAPPVSSIRWEMLREGVEDYEYLWLLRDRLAKRRGSKSAEEVKRIEGCRP